MTNGWVDIRNADVILVMGGNPAENHPCGFKWVIEAKKKRNAKLIVVDPRFTRTAAVADHFAQIRVGTDIAFLLGLIRYALGRDRYHRDYVAQHTNAGFLVGEGFALSEATGLFGGFDAEKQAYDRSGWAYELGPDGYAVVDPTLEHPRSVFQLLRRHVERYTPEVVGSICGLSPELFERTAELITASFPADRAGTILYALGWTHHSTSVQTIRAAAMLQLLLGNVGRPGGGVNALRGHSNIQGATDMAGAFHVLPGYLKAPSANHDSLAAWSAAASPRPLRPEAVNYAANAPKFMVSLLKAFFGEHATAENDFAYHHLPKLPEGANHSWVNLFDDMVQGKLKGMVSFGMNPVANGPNSPKMVAALSKLDFLVMIENFENETATFWKAPADLGGAAPADIATEVFQLPAANFAEKDGSFTNSARWVQWKWQAVDPPGQARPDQEILARIVLALRELYRQEGGAFPDPVLQLTWDYANPTCPSLDEVAREVNGRALVDLKDAAGNVTVKAGQQLATFGALAADGSTASGNWVYCGSYTEAGNLAKRRDTADPTGLGMFPQWAWNWPANRRVLYNRAGADAAGQPWDPQRPGLRWTGSKWAGDVPDFTASSPPEAGLGAFVMLPEGVAKLYAGEFVDGPFPEHYEAAESPVPNQLHPAVSSNPALKRFTSAHDLLADSDADREAFPIICTTYRLTEHFHYWTQHNPMNVQLQPEFFVEIPVELAAEKGIANQDLVRLTSKRGSLEGKALVTKRIKPMTVDGRQVWQIGFPIHWGYTGRMKGALANLLTAAVTDPNSGTPEYKAFLVRLEKV